MRFKNNYLQVFSTINFAAPCKECKISVVLYDLKSIYT